MKSSSQTFPLDDLDISILCAMSDFAWVGVADLIGKELHGKLRRGAVDSARYRLDRLVEFGLLHSRIAPTTRKRTEYKLNTNMVQIVNNATLITENGVPLAIPYAFLVGRDLYSHDHE